MAGGRQAFANFRMTKASRAKMESCEMVSNLTRSQSVFLNEHGQWIGSDTGAALTGCDGGLVFKGTTLN